MSALCRKIVRCEYFKLFWSVSWVWEPPSWFFPCRHGGQIMFEVWRTLLPALFSDEPVLVASTVDPLEGEPGNLSQLQPSLLRLSFMMRLLRIPNHQKMVWLQLRRQPLYRLLQNQWWVPIPSQILPSRAESSFLSTLLLTRLLKPLSLFLQILS